MILLPGDVVDFWRVEELVQYRLLRLRAEMKLRGRAWLQFEVTPRGGGSRITQTAIFDPVGLAGNAEIGDRLEVDTGDGYTRIYQVVERTMYGKSELPAERIFDSVSAGDVASGAVADPQDMSAGGLVAVLSSLYRKESATGTYALFVLAATSLTGLVVAVSATFAPRARNASTIDLPMPREPPVTSATLPSNSFITRSPGPRPEPTGRPS